MHVRLQGRSGDAGRAGYLFPLHTRVTQQGCELHGANRPGIAWDHRSARDPICREQRNASGSDKVTRVVADLPACGTARIAERDHGLSEERQAVFLWGSVRLMVESVS